MKFPFLSPDSTIEYHPLSDVDKLSETRSGPARQPNSTRWGLYVQLAGIALLSLQTLFLVVLLAREAPSNDAASLMIHKSFGSNERFMSLSHEYDFLWDSQTILKAGVISLEKDESGKTTHIGAIAMFHQLHCLRSFRSALQKAYEGGNVAFDFKEDQHWPHCLFYLHQAIMCYGDDTIEAGHSWNGSRPFVEGATDLRVCKDTSSLYKMFKEKRA